MRTGRFPSEVLRLSPNEQALCLMSMHRTLEAEDQALQAIKNRQKAARPLPMTPAPRR